MPAKSYMDVSREYDRFRAFGYDKPMSEFARERNIDTGSNDYAEGLRDGTWTKLSHQLDENVFKPIGEPIGAVTGAIGSIFGPKGEEAGRAVGESLPRMAGEIALSAIPGVGIPLMATAMAAHTYADTGSYGAAAVSGGVGAAMPFAGRLAGNAAATAFGVGERVAGTYTAESMAAQYLAANAARVARGAAPLTTGIEQTVSRVAPIAGKELGYKTAQFLGHEASNFALMQGQGIAQHNILGEEAPYEVFNAHYLAQQIPWTIISAFGIRGKAPMDSTKLRTQLEPKGAVTPPAPAPRPVTRTDAQKVATAELITNYMASGDKSAAATKAIIDAITNPDVAFDAAAELAKLTQDATPVVGDDPTAIKGKVSGTAGPPVAETTFTLRGRAERTSNGKYKMEIANGPEDPFWLTEFGKTVEAHKNVFVPEKDIIDNGDGTFTANVPELALRTGVKFPIKAAKVVDPRPDLPVIDEETRARQNAEAATKVQAERDEMTADGLDMDDVSVPAHAMRKTWQDNLALNFASDKLKQELLAHVKDSFPDATPEEHLNLAALGQKTTPAEGTKAYADLQAFKAGLGEEPTTENVVTEEGVTPIKMTADERVEHLKLREKDLTEDGLSELEAQRLGELDKKETYEKRLTLTQNNFASLEAAGVIISDDFFNSVGGVENHITGWTKSAAGFIEIRVESHTAVGMNAELITLRPGDTLDQARVDYARKNINTKVGSVIKPAREAAPAGTGGTVMTLAPVKGATPKAPKVASTTSTAPGSDFDIVYGSGYHERTTDPVAKADAVAKFDAGYSLKDGQFVLTTQEKVNQAKAELDAFTKIVKAVNNALSEAGLLDKTGELREGVTAQQVDAVTNKLPIEERGRYFLGSDIAPTELMRVTKVMAQDWLKSKKYLTAIEAQFEKTQNPVVTNTASVVAPLVARTVAKPEEPVKRNNSVVEPTDTKASLTEKIYINDLVGDDATMFHAALAEFDFTPEEQDALKAMKTKAGGPSALLMAESLTTLAEVAEFKQKIAKVIEAKEKATAARKAKTAKQMLADLLDTDADKLKTVSDVTKVVQLTSALAQARTITDVGAQTVLLREALKTVAPRFPKPDKGQNALNNKIKHYTALLNNPAFKGSPELLIFIRGLKQQREGELQSSNAKSQEAKVAKRLAERTAVRATELPVLQERLAQSRQKGFKGEPMTDPELETLGAHLLDIVTEDANVSKRDEGPKSREAGRVIQTLQKHMERGADRPNISGVVLRGLAVWDRTTSLTGLDKILYTLIRKDVDVNTIKDYGKGKAGTREETEAFVAKQENPDEWEIETRKLKGGKESFRAYRIVQKESLDAPVKGSKPASKDIGAAESGVDLSEGGTLGESMRSGLGQEATFAKEDGVFSESVAEEPVASVEDLYGGRGLTEEMAGIAEGVEALDRLSPEERAELLPGMSPDAYTFAKAALAKLQETSETAMDLAKNVAPLVGEGQDATNLIRLVGLARDVNYNGIENAKAYSAQMLNLNLRDPVLRAEMGIDSGRVQDVLQWIGAQSDEVYSWFAREYTKLPFELRNLKLKFDGEGFVPGEMFYDRGTATINVGIEPTRKDLKAWMHDFTHETTHHMERTLSSQPSPEAIRYRQQKELLLNAVLESPLIPAPVRDAVKKMRAQNLFNLLGGTPNELKGIFYKAYKEYVAKTYPETENQSWLSNLTGKNTEAKAVKNNWELAYALLSPTEFSAEAFSNPRLKQLLAAVKVTDPKTLEHLKGAPTPKPTVLRLFAQALNALFKGKADGDSVMELLIGAKDKYFTARSAGALYEGLPFLNKLLINETDYLPAEFTLRLRSADAAYGRSLEGGIVNFEIALNAGIRVADPLNPAVRTAPNIREMLETKSAEGRANLYTDLHNTIVALLPTDVVYHKALMERLQQDVRIVKQLRSAKGIEVGKPEDLNARIEHYDSLLKAMESAIVKQEKAIIAQQAVLLKQPKLVQEIVALKKADKAEKALIAKPKRLKDEVIDEKDRVLHGRQYTAAETEAVSQRTGLERLEEGGGRTSFMQRAVMLAQFFAEAHPSVRKLTDSLFARQGNMYESILSRAAARVTRTGFTVKEMLQNIDRVTKSRVIREGYNDYFTWRAEQRRAGNYNPSMSHPDVVRMFRGLTPNERTTLTTQITQDINQHKYWITQARGQMGELNHLDTSHVAMVVGDMNREEATRMSEAMYTALGYARNPQTAAMGSQRLTVLAEQYASPVFVAVMQHANARTASLESFMQGISRFDAYISLQRYEKHHLRMVNADGRIYRIGRDSIQELQEIRGRKEREGFSFLSLTEKPEGSDLQGGMSGPMMQLFQDMDTASLSSLEQALQGHPDAANLMERIAPLLNRTDEYRATQESFSPIPMKRNLTLGYEDIDLFKNRDEFYKRTENWFNHKLTVADTNLHLLHPEIAGNEELRTWSRQHVQNYLTPDNPLVRIINEGVYYQNLALNFGNMMLEGFQSFTTGMQTFISNTGSIGTSGELLIGANTKILNRNRTGRWSSPELAWLMQKAELQGMTEPMLFDNTVDVQTHNLMDSIATSKVKQGLNVTRGLVRKIGGFLQTYNNKVALIAAFDLLHSRGELTYSSNPLAPLNFTELNSALNFARGIKNQATFTGGKAQRSVELWSIKTRAVPQLMTSLTTYVQGWFSQMAKDYSKGFGAQAGRFTQAENNASRKAFMYGLAAQMVLAGGLGLPGAMQAVALVQQATGLDLKGWLKQNLAKLFNEDQDNGGFLTTFALHGAANALTPIDLSGKAAISVPLIGIDPYKGLNLASLFGANGSTVESAAKGVMAALHGDAKGFASALPQAFRGTAQLLQGEGDIRDSRGGLQAQLTPIEQVAVALGIPLSRVQNSKDAADALSKQNKALQKTRGELVDRLATMLRRGQNKEVQAELQGLQSLDPTLDLKSLVRTIAERVNAQTFVADPRRMANPGADLAGLQTGGLQSQELARLQQRQQSEAAMGLLPPRRRPMRAGRLTPEDQAMQMDDMMDLDPALQSSAARRQIEERRKAGRRYTPPQFDWSQSPSQ